MMQLGFFMTKGGFMTSSLYRIPEFCQQFGVSRSTIYRELNAGRLKAVKVGRRTLLAEEDIDAWWMQRYQLRSYIPRVRRGSGNRTVMQRLRKTYNRIIQKRS